jgi:hypothetical protein
MPFEISPKIIKTNPWVADHRAERGRSRTSRPMCALFQTVSGTTWTSTSTAGRTPARPSAAPSATRHSCRPAPPSAITIRSSGSGRHLRSLMRGEYFSSTEEGHFGLPESVSDRIFLRRTSDGQAGEDGDVCGYGVRMRDVTQAMVADRIDHWLATGEIR